jgi:hypothetical protein
MREYLLRLRQSGDEFTATIREFAVASHPEVRAITGPVASGVGATAPAAMVNAIANAHIPALPAATRDPHGS